MSRPIGEMVREFHEAIGHKPTPEANGLLITEEYNELSEVADPDGDVDKMLKEAADLVYVTVGFMQALGADADAVLEAVHLNNLGKRSAGRADAAGKWVKPKGYPTPSVRCDCGDVLHFGPCAVIQPQRSDSSRGNPHYSRRDYP